MIDRVLDRFPDEFVLMGHRLPSPKDLSIIAMAKTGINTLRVDDQRWERWRAAAEKNGITLAEWVRTTLDREDQ